MKYSVLILALASAMLLSACGTTGAVSDSNSVKKSDPVRQPTPSANNAHTDDGAPRIGLADAKADFDKGAAVFIDTRPEDTYKQEHVMGAINITLQDDAAKYGSIPKGKKIIVYCS